MPTHEAEKTQEVQGERLFLFPNRWQLPPHILPAGQNYYSVNYNYININVCNYIFRLGDILKKVLFLCVGNSCRSQMAEGWARELGKGILEARSAGTKPAPAIARLAVEAMREKGVDISGQMPKPLTAELVEWANILISMGCGVERSCPAIYLDLFEDWKIEDPFGGTIEDYRVARDRIEARVRELILGIRD